MNVLNVVASGVQIESQDITLIEGVVVLCLTCVINLIFLEEGSGP